MSGSLKDKNTVFYRLYPAPSNTTSTTTSNTPSNTTSTTTSNTTSTTTSTTTSNTTSTTTSNTTSNTTSLETLRLQCLEHLHSYLDVIWNTEHFTLSISNTNTNTTNTISDRYLYGQVWYDNSLEDEWYVVWLLWLLSKQFNLMIQTWDDDGEFLLIEAAETLPRWVVPDNSDNRMWVYRGHFLLIPQPRTPAELQHFPAKEVSIEQALKCLEKVTPCHKLNEVLQSKLASFPRRSTHRIRCHLPVSLVHALTLSPTLISSLISIYLYSDKHEIQSVIRNRALDWTETRDTNLTLTRCQYAQLFSQRLTTTASWPHVPVGHPDHLARQLGLKITLGAELGLTIAAHDTVTDKGFSNYITRLGKLGYFSESLEGSKAYTGLLEKAKVYYRASQPCDAGSYWACSNKQLEELVTTNTTANTSSEGVEVLESESDGWMDNVPEEVEKWFLSGRRLDKMGTSDDVTSPSDDVTQPSDDVTQPSKKEAAGLSELNAQLQGFINSISSYEGVEVNTTTDNTPTTTTTTADDGDISFNVEDFMECLRGFREQLDPAESEDESDDTSSLDTESDEEMQEYMRDLEQQLSGTTVTEGYERDKEGEVDIDINLVSNILKSFTSEQGLAGPTSSVLASLGVHLPRDEDITS